MAKREIWFRWTAYALCTLLLLFLRSVLLVGALRLLGAQPFLPPILLTCVASHEDLRSAAIFGLVFGVFCDLTLSAPLPCLFTVAFTLSALLTAYLSEKVFQNYLLRALSGTALTFLLTDLLCMLALALSAGAPFFSMLSLAMRETVASLPLLVVYPLFTAIRRFFVY